MMGLVAASAIFEFQRPVQSVGLISSKKIKYSVEIHKNGEF
jgi:hypothetical protein